LMASSTILGSTIFRSSTFEHDPALASVLASSS
jgi:hypothetical protein